MVKLISQTQLQRRYFSVNSPVLLAERCLRSRKCSQRIYHLHHHQCSFTSQASTPSVFRVRT